MLKRLLSALFKRKKKICGSTSAEKKIAERPISRLHKALGQPRSSTTSARSSAQSHPPRHDDCLANPMHPLSPLNPINSVDYSHGASESSTSRCDDSSSRSNWSSGDSSYGCSSSSDSSSSSSSSDSW